MGNQNLKERTKRFALDTISLVESLPSGQTSAVLGRQLLRSGTSVGANYRAACRAKSPADFVFKMGIVEEEADESSFWIELLVDAGKLSGDKAAALLKECNELVAISVTSIRTARNSSKHNVVTSAKTPRSMFRTPHSV